MYSTAWQTVKFVLWLVKSLKSRHCVNTLDGLPGELTDKLCRDMLFQTLILPTGYRFLHASTLLHYMTLWPKALSMNCQKLFTYSPWVISIMISSTTTYLPWSYYLLIAHHKMLKIVLRLLPIGLFIHLFHKVTNSKFSQNHRKISHFVW